MTESKEQASENIEQEANKASVFKHPDMAQYSSDPKSEQVKDLSKWEMVKQGVSLLWALGNMKKFNEAADQMERSMVPVIIAGVVSMILFFSIAFGASQLLLKLSGVK